MRKRKPEGKFPHKVTSNGLKLKKNNDLSSQTSSYFTIILVCLFIFILFGVLGIFRLMSTSDSKTEFQTNASKFEKRADKSVSEAAVGTAKETIVSSGDSKESPKAPEYQTKNTETENSHKSQKQQTGNTESVDSRKSLKQQTGDTESVDSRKSPKQQTENTEQSKKSQGIPSKIEEEMRNFKRTIQKHISPKKIFADGRRLPPTELLPQKPNNSSVRVYLYNDFLSPEECDGLMKAHTRHVKELSNRDPIVCFDSIKTLRHHLKAANVKRKVSPRDFTPGTTCLNTKFSSEFKDMIHSNWSYSTAFYPGESRFSTVFEHRIKEAIGLEPKNGGKFQITSYPLNVGYKTHTDCIEQNPDKRDRVATILVYLQDVEEGGETQFPELGIWVKPRKGRALVWNNMNTEGSCEHMSLHQAAKVTKGHKYILQRWYYYESFYSLGKRPPGPHIPQMEDGTARVSCDEYEHGSCRWYDEWNYDHIIEYQNQKASLI